MQPLLPAPALPPWLFAKPFEPDWIPPPACPELAANDVHIWRAPLDLPSERLTALQRVLSAAERQRASRFVRAQDRQRFIAARGHLRVLLGRYLQCQPEQLVFTYNEYGKPALADAAAPRFNLAHSEGLALYAVSQAQPLGIDVEAECAAVEFEALWTRIASAAEQGLWPALPQPLRRRAFFQLWTRKEAVIKALGLGLSFPLVSLTVLGATADLVVGATAAALRLQSFCPQPDYVAALATAGQLDCQWFGLT